MSQVDTDRFAPCLSGSLPGQLVIQVRKDAPAYDGPYTIEPSIDGCRLSTSNKMMAEDVHIQPIPYYTEPNGAGGSTVYIGKEK